MGNSAIGAMLVYDTTNKESFQNVQKWLEETRTQGNANVQFMLIGNKVDLTEEYFLILKEEPSDHMAIPLIGSI